jgi:hypothetical protein
MHSQHAADLAPLSLLMTVDHPRSLSRSATKPGLQPSAGPDAGATPAAVVNDNARGWLAATWHRAQNAVTRASYTGYSDAHLCDSSTTDAFWVRPGAPSATLAPSLQLAVCCFNPKPSEIRVRGQKHPGIPSWLLGPEEEGLG